MNDLRERVARIFAESGDAPLYGDDLYSADMAITAVIEALAAEALEAARQERIRDGVDPDGFRTPDGDLLPPKGGTCLTRYEWSDWLRAHLDDGRDGEAG